MKKYLLIALAALGFTACTEAIDDTLSNTPNGELEESYIAINLMSADKDTRAATDTYGYEMGTDIERTINSAYFFFFDAEGNPFNVNNAPATAPGGSKNHLSLTINAASTSGMPNVSDIKNAVLVLSTYKGVYPSKIVAVLNWAPENKAYSLSELHNELATIGNDTNGYVMSNSVYMNAAGQFVDAVPLTTANIKTSETDAKNAPVEIYVERIAAKVVLTASGKVEDTENIFDTQKDPTLLTPQGETSNTLVPTPSTDVYVKLLGWELYNDYSTSYLVKNIQNWNVADLGLTWNDIPYYRCYWALSQSTSQGDEFAWSYDNAAKAAKGFQTNYGFNVASTADYTNRTTYTYLGENTRQKDGSSDPRTKVILKAQLMQKNGGNYTPLELARWYGTEYAGNEALRIAVANSLKFTLYSSTDGRTFSPIAPEDIECAAGVAGTKAYEVGFKLSTAGRGKKWYRYSSENGYIAMADIADQDAINAAANAHLATLEPALVYTNGQTYYFLDIEHLGTAGKPAKYGVVRNHVYQVDIESIKGYGSPVYNGLGNIVTPPDYPIEDEASYVAARINVLSWKVVKQGVNIVQ